MTDEPDIRRRLAELSIGLIFLHERVIVVDKPAGLLSVPGIGEANQDCLARRVASVVEGALIVHRLDRETSGLMVMARDADAHRDLSRQFEERTIEKVYHAEVCGVMRDDEGEISLPLRKDIDRKARHMVDHERGKPALTQWRVLERLSDRTRLELRPLTGRSHQLRIHLMSIGHAIIGDDLYGPGNEQNVPLQLRSCALGFRLPGSSERMRFEV